MTLLLKIEMTISVISYFFIGQKIPKPIQLLGMDVNLEVSKIRPRTLGWFWSKLFLSPRHHQYIEDVTIPTPMVLTIESYTL